MAIELDTLEIIIDANLERIEKQMAKIQPFFEKAMKNMGQTADKESTKITKSMDVNDGVSKLEKQLEEMKNNYEKQLAEMKKATESSSEDIGKGMSAGFSKARKTSVKEVDQIVEEINAKMGQAKAQQEKMAYLKTQRQGSVANNDNGKKVRYDEQFAGAQEKMTKYHGAAKQLANSMKQEYDEIPHTLDSITNKMEMNEGKIESIRKKIKSMQADYQNSQETKGSFSKGFKTVDTPKSIKINDQILKQTEQMNALIQKNDSLQRAYAMAEDRAKSLSSGMKKVNTTMSSSSRQTETAGSGVRRFGRIITQSRGLISRFGAGIKSIGTGAKKGFSAATSALSRFVSKFGRGSRNVNKQSKSMTRGIGGFGRRLGQMVKQVFVFSLIYKGLNLVGRGLMSSLNTNEQFSQSMNQIKVNLMTAFYPIYTAILPAVNALMKGLSAATAYMAQFIATLFGTTYSAAKQGAQGLYQNVQAMEDTGSQADKTKEKVKKLQRSLMGFDQINTLGQQQDDDSSLDDKKGVNFAGPDPAIPESVTTWANQFKNLLKDFFAPFSAAWKNQGQRVMDAWKYATSQVIGLVKAIGKSFMEVWTNGTGQRFIENILILFADVLNIIGDIAGAFKKAWEDNGRGTALIQSIFDLWNSVFELLHEIAVAFRDAWNDGNGERIAGNILEIFTNIFSAIGNITDQIKKAWKQGGVGESIFNVILTIVGDLLEAIKKITKGTSDWAKKLDFTKLLESIDRLLKAIQPITKNIFDGLAWFWNEILLPLAGYVITDLIPVFLDAISGALKVINEVIEIFKPLGQWLFDNFLVPVASWTGGKIVDILKGIGDILSEIGDWLADNKELIQLFAELGFDIIKGLFDGIVEKLGNVGNWLRENIFDPIYNGFKSLFGIHSPSTVFSDLGGFLISGLWNGINDTISSVVDLVGGIFGSIKDTVETKCSEIWETAKNIWGDVKDTVISAVSDAWENTKQTWIDIKDSVVDTASAAWEVTKEKWGDIKENIVSACSDIWSNVKETWGNITETVGDKASDLWNGAKDTWDNVTGTVGNASTDIWNGTKDTWSKVSEKISDAGQDIVKATKDEWKKTTDNTDKTWSTVSKSISDSAEKSTKWVGTKWADITNATGKNWKSLTNDTGKTWSNIQTNISDSSERARKWVGDKWSNLKSTTQNTWSRITQNTSGSWSAVGSLMKSSAENAKNQVTSAWSTMSNKIGGFNDTIKSKTKSAFDAVSGWAGGLGKKMGTGLSNGFEAVKKGAKNIAKGVIDSPVKAVNGVLGGVRWVLKKVGASDTANGIKNFELPTYASGTGHHPGGYALVNDGLGSKYREAYQTPDGRTGIFPAQRNLMVNLPKGTSVLSGPQTASTYGMPAYANGIGDWFSDKWNQVKEFTGDVWDYATNPSKLLNIGISKLVNLGGAMDPALSIAQGAIGKTTEAATNFVKEKMDAFFSSSGSFDGSIGSLGVYKYLSDIAQKVIGKFPGMRMTSGLREGDPYYHGKRQAIDIAFPASMNGGPDNVKAANYAFDTFASKVGYVITNGKVRDRSGMSGTGKSGSWVHWPDNDHYDHVHINGLLGANDIGAGGSSPSGSGVERWRSTIQRALSKNGLPTSAQYTNAWLRQVQSESGGNEKAVQGGYTDINTITGDLAKGLLQTISATFNAYKHSGYNDIFNGFDNALAAINYAKNRYGSSGMLQVIGHGHGYENGGRINTSGYYRLGEGNKEEWIIPMEKPNTAKRMVLDAMEFLGIDMPMMGTLQMPEIFRENKVTTGMSSNFRNPQTAYDGGGIQSLSDLIVNGLLSALQNNSQNQQKSTTGDIVVNIGGHELGRLAIKEINKEAKRLGFSPLIL